MFMDSPKSNQKCTTKSKTNLKPERKSQLRESFILSIQKTEVIISKEFPFNLIEKHDPCFFV